MWLSVITKETMTTQKVFNKLAPYVIVSKTVLSTTKTTTSNAFD